MGSRHLDRQVRLRGKRKNGRRALLARGSGLAAVLAVALAIVPAGGQVVLDDVLAALFEWNKIESVLTHPRCLNCHTTTDYPTTGDERRPHMLQVKRGPDGHGSTIKCQACHGAENRVVSGIPGAPDWHMAPLSLAWEKAPGERASSAAICASLKHGNEDDGQPDFEGLIEYAQLAAFVHWAWEPGERRDGTARSLPPISQAQFVNAVKRWISAGAPCPPVPPPPGAEVTSAIPAVPTSAPLPAASSASTEAQPVPQSAAAPAPANPSP